MTKDIVTNIISMQDLRLRKTYYTFQSLILNCYVSHYHIPDPKYGMPSQIIFSEVSLLLISRLVEILRMYLAFCLVLDL